MNAPTARARSRPSSRASDPPGNRPPRVSRRLILPLHILAMVLIQSSAVGVMAVMPVLARRHFGATDVQTVLITAAVPTLLSLSIFWNDLLRRMTLRRYLFVYWGVALMPLGLVAFAQSYWHVLTLYLIAAAGAGGSTPVNGEVLRRFYPERSRGRVFGTLTLVVLAGGMGSSFAVGAWLKADHDAFRIYMPLSALLQLIGVGLLGWLTWVRRTQRRRRIESGPMNLRRILEPVGHMREVLRADNAFFRYEAAFMTYGIGWMCCQALLPILATDKLHLTYDQYQNSTQVIFNALMLIMIFPAGWLLDRIGAVRTCAIAFTLLTLYPLGLLVAGGAAGVALASAAYGLAMAGVHQGWTLGPVAFAPTRDKAAHYAAIHATLVGIRGILFQALAMFLYKLTGGFFFPLLIAATGFAWAAGQMIRLHQRMAVATPQQRRTPGVPPVQTATAGAATPSVR